MVSSSHEKMIFVQNSSTAAIDQLFSLRPVTETNRQGEDYLYLGGISPEALYTSYHDLLEAMNWLYGQGARSWCDLGCGIGRTCFLWSWLFPDTASFGVELISERLDVARGASQVNRGGKHFWIEGDFAAPDFQLPQADVYFLYLATGPQLDALLGKLKEQSQSAWVVVIESHGDLKPRLQLESWWLLPSSQRFALSSHRHDPWVQLYRTRPQHPLMGLERNWRGRLGLLPMELALHPSPLGYLLSKSFQKNWELVIAEEEEMWTMETLGLRWHAVNTLQGAYPPRQLTWGKGQVGLRYIPGEHRYRQWAQWRRTDCELLCLTRDGQRREKVRIRKIIIFPTQQLEFSDGTRVEVSHLQRLEAMT